MEPTSPLWVIDDGVGMDAPGFHQLWRIADSNKTHVGHGQSRAPIGQFGIGKLAAYVLAWRLVHLSLSNGRYLYTTMNFRNVSGRQNDAPSPVSVELREVSAEDAKSLLVDIEHRDPDAWSFLFGSSPARNWTVAALDDFKELYHRLQTGRLQWVLRTGLPLLSNFRVCVNRETLTPRRSTSTPLREFPFTTSLPGIGTISGKSRIYEDPLTTGKAERLGRSHGYFVRVRRRVINLEDELFGTAQPNHAAWHRFALEVDADGLHTHLLSSREGVRDSDHIQGLRHYLVQRFRECRNVYDDWYRNQIENLDLPAILSRRPSLHVTEPITSAVRSVLPTREDSFYFQASETRDLSASRIAEIKSQIAEKPIDGIEFAKDGRHAAVARYQPTSRRLVINTAHPFIDKVTEGGRRRGAAQLFASAETVLEGQLHARRLAGPSVASILAERDRVLRVVAGEAPSTASSLVRCLNSAEDDSEALERAVGESFHALGFEYQRGGGSRPGPDGYLRARLGHIAEKLGDYRLVYDAKQTGSPRVSASKLNFTRLNQFVDSEGAAFGFFIARDFDAAEDPTGVLNRAVAREENARITLMTLAQVRRLVRMHFRFGITLAEIHEMFRNARTTTNVTQWIDEWSRKRTEERQVDIARLLQWIEEEKGDPWETPNLNAVRAKHPELKSVSVAALSARLSAVEHIVGKDWIEVVRDDVVMRQRPASIVRQLEREAGLLEGEWTESDAEC